MSFNTALGTAGWALQGDYTLHLDTPLQRAERIAAREKDSNRCTTSLELATRGLRHWPSRAEAVGRRGGGSRCDRSPGGRRDRLRWRRRNCAAQARDAQRGARAVPMLATYEALETFGGYVRHDVSQIQATATKYFGPVLGADGLVFVTEAAVMHVHSMTDDPLESPARASTVGDDVDEDGISDGDGDADATSWGYRMAARLDYNNAVGAVNLFPYVQWRHDVNGNSPAPSGSFSEGLTALTLGLRADYLSSWQANVGYTRYGGRRNTLRDRDFISASINYSF